MRPTALAILALGSLVPALLSAHPAPEAPNAGVATSTLMAPEAPAEPTPAVFPSAPNKPRTRTDMQPVRVSIPSIGLRDPIENMGILRNGELAVPSGSTNNVGWWSGGTIPGQIGSAVLDAHVFAAFKNLNNVKVGDEIYITDADGTVLKFMVESTQAFKLANLSADYLYNRADARRLTLITCAGQLTPDHSTYTHRLVVSAVLAS